ncbi:MAG: hypothetical protein NWE88_00735 [Candidatus Bathyarchaeota archaeon]|nr:hypothetical protein [Candidatus Bathyarchaeota archaeon]
MASKSITLLLVGLIIGGALGIYGLDYIEIPGLGGGYLSLYEELREDYATLTDEHVELLGRFDDLSAELDALQGAYEELSSSYDLLTSSLELVPEPEDTGFIEREYLWDYGGYSWTLSLSIPDSLYRYYGEKERIETEDYSIYVTHPDDDDYLGTIIREFNRIALEEGYTEAEKVHLIITFVQSLPYTSDSVTTGFDEYPRYPIETLVEYGGDCEDTSILTAAFLDALYYDVILINPPEHMAVGIGIDAYGTYWELDGEKYFYLETTGEGWEIGEMPPEYESGTAYIYEMEPTPIITHDWQATTQGTRLTLIVEVKNSGTSAARLIKVYGAFDAGGDSVWNPVESEPFNLNIGASATVQIELEAPPGEHTRLIIGVMGAEGYLLDRSYSEWFDT